MAQTTNPLRRRIRLVAWLSSLGGGLATAAIIAGVSHTAADASSTPSTSTSTSTPASTSSTSTSSTSTSTGSSVSSADQNTAPHGGSNGS